MRTLAVTALVLGLAAPAAGQDMGARSGEQDAGMPQGKATSRRTPDPRMTDSRNPRSPGAGSAGSSGSPGSSGGTASGRGSAGAARAGDAGRSDPAKAPSPGPADPSHNGVPSQTEKAKDARRPADTPSR
ncbi:MAG: hypothetical protein U1A78_39485 [Polyangia bacterium]